MWQTTPPKQDTGKTFRHGPIVLRYEPPRGNREAWCNLSMTFGRHTNSTETECLYRWPVMAISEARAALDDLERYLMEQTNAVTTTRTG
jgi:hypothetical protein